jgi:hypothetical protein
MYNGTDIRFVQTDSHGSDRECFDWTGFPTQFESAIPYIVEAIDDAMRVMD